MSKRGDEPNIARLIPITRGQDVNDMSVSRNSDLFLLREAAVAERLDVSIPTLRRWRKTGEGPGWLKLTGGAVRYERSTLEDWIKSKAVGAGECQDGTGTD